MKIRKGFVTNSSSTSFILICSDIFNEEDFLELMGVKKESDFYEMMQALFINIEHSLKSLDDYLDNPYWEEYNQSFEEHLKEEYSEEVYKRFLKAKGEDKYIYFGKLSSDDELLSAFICCDHFIEENDKIYFNYANCYW